MLSVIKMFYVCACCFVNVITGCCDTLLPGKYEAGFLTPNYSGARTVDSGVGLDGM